MKMIEREWRTFANEVLHKVPVQLIPDFKLAFYGGATALFGKLVRGVSSDTGDPTPEELQMVDSVAKELEEFAAYCKIYGKVPL
jgi:hypothetical protein